MLEICGRVFNLGMRLSPIILLAIVLNVAAPTFAAEPITGVPRIIDGDTIIIAGERIRLDWIDAPETRQQCNIEGKKWACGVAATNALNKLIGTSQVRCQTHGRGKYGRILGICYLGKENINAWMVRNGWAVDYRKYSNGAYAREEAMAKSERRGIWQGDFIAPWDWRRGRRLEAAAKKKPSRCLIKGNISRSGTRIYHVPGGAYYKRTKITPSKGERWFCSEAEAGAAGWRRSRR